jgi:hypothetical protein
MAQQDKVILTGSDTVLDALVAEISKDARLGLCETNTHQMSVTQQPSQPSGLLVFASLTWSDDIQVSEHHVTNGVFVCRLVFPLARLHQSLLGCCPPLGVSFAMERL